MRPYLHEFLETAYQHYDIAIWYVKYVKVTVGADKNETLVFVNFSAKDASKLKISVPIIKRRS